MKNEIKATNYEIVSTVNDKFKEIVVTYTLNNQKKHYFIFVDARANWKTEDYLKKAKEIFNADLKKNKIKAGSAHRVPPVAFAIMSVAAVAFAGLFTWKYLTGGNGGGVIPQPGPVQWETITKDDALEIRSNVLTYQLLRNPLDMLNSQNAKQFKITDYNILEGGKFNEGNYKKEYYVDTGSLYIKNVNINIKNNKDDNPPEYCVYHEFGETTKEHENGLHHCYTDDGGSPASELLYEASTLDDTMQRFVPANDYNNVSYWVGRVYGSDAYKINQGTIPAVDNFIQTFKNMFEGSGVEPKLPELTYEKGNDLSFKITDDEIVHVTVPGYGEFNVTCKFDLTVENAMLKKYESELKIPQLSVDLKKGITIEETPFELDDLSAYFADK